MNRRDFIKCAVAAAGVAAMHGEARSFTVPKGEKIRSALLHLGMNMWCDWENPKPLSYGWEETVIRWPSDKVRADMTVWRDWTDAMVREKLNMAVIDIGEALRLESHPELAVRGSWSPERMKKELDRLWTDGSLDQMRLDELQSEHLRTPYRG